MKKNRARETYEISLTVITYLYVTLHKKRTEKGRKNILKSTGPKLLKFNERRESINPKSSKISKQDKFKEIQTTIHQTI